MAKTQEYKLSQDGKKTLVSDTTVWGGENGERSSFALIFGLLKYSESGFSVCPLFGSDPVNIVDDNPTFVFSNKSDGYYRIRAVYAGVNSSASQEGSVYYDTSQEKIYLYTEGSFKEVSYSELMLYNNDLLDEVKTDIGFAPILQKAIDKIWYEYFVSRQIHDGKDYKNFSLLYALFVGASASLAEGAFAEYENKIANANKIALRKLKEIK